MGSPTGQLKDGVVDDEEDNEDIIDESDSDDDESEKGDDGRPDDLAIIQGLL